MLELIQKIKDHTEAGVILEHMYLFDELEELYKDTVSLMGVAIDNENIKEDSYIEELNRIIDIGCIEESHYHSDKLLCEILRSYGYDKLISIYEDMEKWYA